MGLLHRYADAIVIGGGLAGLSAANRIAGCGFTVLVLEQGGEADYVCNSRYTGGLFHIAMDDMKAEPAAVAATLHKITAGQARPELVEALVGNVARAQHFLRSLGVRFITAGPDGLRRNSLAPPGLRQTGLNWRGRGGDRMLRTLGDSLRERGGRIILGSRAYGLAMRDGRCQGVMAQSGDRQVRFHGGAVVIADGGFQADLELLKRFISPAPERLLQRNARTGHGAGLRMAEAAGAKLTGMDRFYGHIHHRSAMQNGGLWPYPVVDSVATAGIVVDGRGRRFCDEGGGGVYITNEIARLADPLSASIILDSAIWEGPARDWLLPANPNMLSAGGELITANTLPGLAEKLGLPSEELATTIVHYNRYIGGGERPALQPERTTSRFRAWPISAGPFHAIPVCAGITYTMGGIVTDASARVLGDAGPIEGLYAAGSATGGLECGGFAGYSGGLSKAATFGMLAGEAVARFLGFEEAEELTLP